MITLQFVGIGATGVSIARFGSVAGMYSCFTSPGVIVIDGSGVAVVGSGTAEAETDGESDGTGCNDVSERGLTSWGAAAN